MPGRSHLQLATVTGITLAASQTIRLLDLASETTFSPASWGITAIAIWLTYAVLAWDRLTLFDRQQMLWAMVSVTAFFHFLEGEVSFQSWGDGKCSSTYSICQAVLRQNAMCTREVMDYMCAWRDLKNATPHHAVYYFCGPELAYCTCDFKWNLMGWGKALTLWNFVLTSALGAQRLAILIGLNGLLPGGTERGEA